MARGAFTEVLASDPDVRCLLNHDPDKVLARTRAGTLRLTEDERGLYFEADLPDSPAGRDVREAVRRGDIDGASFRFVVGGESWDGDKRTVTSVKELLDVTVATYAAYPAASVELRTRTTTTTSEPAELEEDTTMDNTDNTVEEPETASESRTGALAVEDRAAVSEPPSVEQRVREALLDIRKGENRALTTASTLAPGELSSFLWDKLCSASVGLASGMRVVTTERDTVTYPRLTADVAPGWYDEAATITPGDPTLDSLTATPRKLAHLTVFSNEVIDAATRRRSTSSARTTSPRLV